MKISKKYIKVYYRCNRCGAYTNKDIPYDWNDSNIDTDMGLIRIPQVLYHKCYKNDEYRGFCILEKFLPIIKETEEEDGKV